MVNQEHLGMRDRHKQLSLLKSSVEDWNRWRSRTGIEVLLAQADLSNTNLSGANLEDANLFKANLSGANLNGANLNMAYLYEANLSGANLSRVLFYEADLRHADLRNADLRFTNILYTNFQNSNLTGACIEDWHTNRKTRLDNVICEYVYMELGISNAEPVFTNRRPHDPNENFAPGDFTKIFQESLETVDLIFREGLNWKAFAYSFKKIELENEEARLAIKNIENKGNGVVLVRVSVSPDADKSKINSDFMQGYKFAKRELIPQYEARLQDKDKIINWLIHMAETPNWSLDYEK